MSRTTLGLGGFLALMAASPVAQAQSAGVGLEYFECPASQVGQPCNAGGAGPNGLCVPAACEQTVDRLNADGVDANVPVACVECGACLVYGAGSGYCSDTVTCPAGVPCTNGGINGMGMGPTTNPDQMLVLYQDTYCAPWLVDAGVIAPSAVSTTAPHWDPCGTPGGGEDASTSVDSGTGVEADSAAAIPTSPSSCASSGSGDAAAPPEGPTDGGGVEGGSASSDGPEGILRRGACSIEPGPTGWSWLPVAGIACAAMALSRSRSRKRSRRGE